MLESAAFWASWSPYIAIGAALLAGIGIGVAGQNFFGSYYAPGTNQFSNIYDLASRALAIVGAFAIAMIFAVRHSELSYVRAALVLIIGAAAMLAAFRTVRLFAGGEGIEVQNFWGGIGGGGGGWRLSPATSLMLFALLLTGITVAIALPGKREDGKPATTQSKPASADPTPAVAPPKTQ